MGEPKEIGFWQELWQGITKLAIPATIGIAARLAMNIRERKLTWKDIVAAIVFGVFAGWLASRICTGFGVDKDLKAAITSVAAMMGESFTIFVISNAPKWWGRIANKWAK